MWIFLSTEYNLNEVAESDRGIYEKKTLSIKFLDSLNSLNGRGQLFSSLFTLSRVICLIHPDTGRCRQGRTFSLFLFLFIVYIQDLSPYLNRLFSLKTFIENGKDW